MNSAHDKTPNVYIELFGIHVHAYFQRFRKIARVAKRFPSFIWQRTNSFFLPIRWPVMLIRRPEEKRTNYFQIGSHNVLWLYALCDTSLFRQRLHALLYVDLLSHLDEITTYSKSSEAMICKYSFLKFQNPFEAGNQLNAALFSQSASNNQNYQKCPSLRLRKNAPFLSQSAFSNFVPYAVISVDRPSSGQAMSSKYNKDSTEIWQMDHR